MPVNTPGPARPLDAENLWQELHDPLLAFIARRVGDRGEAEDILQEVMLRIHRQAGDLRRPGAVVAWVHRIARNAIADHHRSPRVRRERPGGIDPGAALLAAPPEVPEEEERGELAACMGPMLRRLPDAQRRALELVEVEGVRQADAAARLGLSVSGMKSRVQRARAALRDMLVRCCEVELDRRGAVIAHRPRGGSCGCRADAPASGPAAASI